VGTVLLLIGGVALPVLVVLTLLSESIGSAIGVPAGWLIVTPLIALAQVVILINLTLWRMRERPIAFGVFQFALASVNIGLSLWFVVGLHAAWQGRVSAMLVARVLFAFVALGLLLRRGDLRLRWRRAYACEALHFGVPLIPHHVGMWVMSVADRLLLSALIGLGATGVYASGFYVAAIIAVVQEAFSKAWTPWLYARLKIGTPEVKRRVVLVTYGYCAALLALSLALVLIAPWFVGIFLGADFQGASSYVTWLAFAFAVNGMYRVVAGYILFERRTAALAWITSVAAVVKVILAVSLIRWVGPLGAAQSTFAAYLVSFILTWIVAQRVHPMPWGLSGRSTPPAAGSGDAAEPYTDDDAPTSG
jgi:O-antigen/teichoic acid export membrane protein